MCQGCFEWKLYQVHTVYSTTVYEVNEMKGNAIEPVTMMLIYYKVHVRQLYIIHIVHNCSIHKINS